MILSIYGELGRVSYYNRRLFSIIKYWFKIINADNRRYIKQVYKLMLEDLDHNPNIRTGHVLLKILYLTLAFIMYGWHKESVILRYF